MKIVRHHEFADIVEAREERTLIFLIYSIVCLMVSFGMMVWTTRVISEGNSNLEMMRERLNAFSLQVKDTEKICNAAAAACQK